MWNKFADKHQPGAGWPAYFFMLKSFWVVVGDFNERNAWKEQSLQIGSNCQVVVDVADDDALDADVVDADDAVVAAYVFDDVDAVDAPVCGWNNCCCLIIKS